MVKNRNAAPQLQSEDWDGVAPAWEKYDRQLMGMDHVNEQLIRRARIERGHSVIDIGSGTGYPALMIAKRVESGGSVTGLDFSDGMLAVARKKAAAMGLKNVEFRTCDASSLPFDDEKFDAATSRFCMMLLPEPDKTLLGICRVLKAGGSLAVSVWAVKEKNPNITIPMEILMEYCPPPEEGENRPGIFSLAEPGVLMEKMRTAGFSELAASEVPVERRFASGQECIGRLKEMAAPFKKMFASLSQGKCREAEVKMVNAIEEFRDGDEVVMPGMALIVSGKKVG